MFQWIVFLSFFTPQFILASNEWYGTVVYQHKTDLRKEITFPSGHAYFPGSEVEYNQRSGSGQIRFLPKNVMIQNSQFSAHWGSDRVTEDMRNCGWKDHKTFYSDVEKNEWVHNFSVNRKLNSSIKFRIEEDGTYKQSLWIEGGKMKSDAVRFHHRRERIDECGDGVPEVNEQFTSDSNNMDLVKTMIQGQAKPDAQQIEGQWEGLTEDGGTVRVNWVLFRKNGPVTAVINWDGSLERGQTITLDASQSVGKIDEYTWEFSPIGDCLMQPAATLREYHDKKISFKALCDFTAHLRVKNDDDMDHARFDVIVTPRQGDDWRTKFSTQVGAPFSIPLISLQLQFGMNQCSKHEEGVVSGHFIHTDSENNSTWIDSGYELEENQEDGPFKGVWWVKSQKLEVSRLERVNAEILPGGATYNLNAAKNNLPAITALANQTKAHEAAHSKLLEEALKRMGPKGDPAARIEKIVSLDESMGQTLADMEVRDGNSALFSATSDVNVKKRLQNSRNFNSQVSIWVRTGNGDEAVLKPLGPLWNVGDH